MQSSTEWQGEKRTPSEMKNAKKQRESIEWEQLDIFSRKLETQGKISYKDGHEK